MGRCCFLVLLGLAVAGCGGPRPSAGAPGLTVQVVQEGIHSGLLVPAGWVWPGVDGVAEVSYGERAWMLDGERGCAHAARLAVWPSDGAIYLRRAGDDAAQAVRRHGWSAQAVPLSPLGAEAVRREMAMWISPDGPALAVWPDGSVFRSTSRRFHAGANCHDAVAAWLRAAGVPLAGPWLPWRTRERFAGEVAAALAELDADGIRWVEPMLE